MGQFDLETVAVGCDRTDIDGRQRLPSEAFEASGRVAEGHAGDHSGVEAAPEGEQQSGQRPIDDANAARVA